MAQPTQVLPYWLSASTTYVTTGGRVLTTTVVVNLPLTYYGPSIPLGPGWVYGGSTSPPPGQTLTSATEAATSAATDTVSSAVSGLTSATVSASASPSLATSSGIPISASSGATQASSASASSVTGPITSSPSISQSQSPSTSAQGPTTVFACTTLGGCPTPTTSSPQAAADHHKLSTGAIVAISLVSAIAAAVILGICILLLARRRRRRYPNRGSPLEGDISALPPAPGEEHGSLLAGRRSGGESPELDGEGAAFAGGRGAAGDDDEEDLSHLPIANKYITERRMSGSMASRPSSRGAGSIAGGRGTYHAIGDPSGVAETSGAGEAAVGAAVAGAAVGAAAAAHQPGEASGSSGSHAQTQTHSSHSRGLFYTSGSGDDHRPHSPTSGGSHEQAEVVTAQRATRSPLARLARLSWFSRGRNAPGTSAAAHADSDDDGGWVNLGSSTRQMAQRSGQPPVTTPLLSQPRSGGAQVPTITRQGPSRNNSATADSSGAPPPVAYFNMSRSRNTRRHSDQSAQSGQTVYFDAEEEPTPSAPAPAFMPRSSTDVPGSAVGASAAAAAIAAGHHQRQSLPPSGSESSRGEGGPTAADFPVPPSGISPSPSYQWPQFRNGDSPNNDSASPSATTESPAPQGQPLPGLFSRSLSGVGQVGAPITTSQGDTLQPPEQRRRHTSAPEQAAGAEARGRLSTLVEAPDGSWGRRALSPVAASAAAAISGASLSGDERSRRMTLGPASFVDTPQIVDQSEVASLRGDVHSSYTGNGTQSNRDSSYPSRNGQGGTMATRSSFSTGGVAQRRLAPTPNRQPSLTALGNRPWSMTSDTGAGTGSDSGTGTGTGSGAGGSSAQQSPQSVRSAPRTTEMGELRPPQRAAVPPSLSIVGERMRPSIDTPPPPPSANPDVEALSPPPPRPWWRPI